jgi:hypothetical protein
MPNSLILTSPSRLRRFRDRRCPSRILRHHFVTWRDAMSAGGDGTAIIRRCGRRYKAPEPPKPIRWNVYKIASKLPR